MANAIWNGVISFGLLNIPVSLHSGQRSTDLHFRMLDSRDNSPIRFERVNAETGEEVPWKQIVKAFEYEKGNYVVLQEEDFKSAAPESLETVEIASFVARDEINPMYFDKPYYLVPGKKAEKGYVLLREVLRKAGRIALGRVVIRTREYLCGLMPLSDALVMMLLRFPQELVSPDEFKLPGGGLAAQRISAREVSMAEQLVESMTQAFDPADYVDDFRARLHEVIDKRIRAQEGTVTTADTEEALPEQATTNVVDFMGLLKKSLEGKKGAGDSKRGTPGRTAAERQNGKPRKASSGRSKPGGSGNVARGRGRGPASRGPSTAGKTSGATIPGKTAAAKSRQAKPRKRAA